MAASAQYRFLEPRPGSNYRQLWVKGRHMRAEVLYRCTIGPEPRTPQEVADDYGLPLEVVLEAVVYAKDHEALLAEERQREETRGIVPPSCDLIQPPAQHTFEV